MRDLVNLVIRCTGCSIEVEPQDIEDPDNVVSKLTEIQDEFQAQKITEYPLISKAKGNASFRTTMIGFFETLINTCHASGLLYSDAALYENLDLWVSTMSSSAIRPFRHTATVISLSMGSALCSVANDLAEHAAKTTRQKEGEQKKKNVNKDRVKALETKITEAGTKRTLAIDNVQQLFDQVYIHRYRDVDPRIRVDCVTALGTWINTLPDHFFEGIYLRYLGWVLSDTFAPTRMEVIKQLAKLFRNKDNVARLRTFTERFRARLVEMSVRDSEVGVRAATIELLDTIRKTGLLEPDDIDNVGRLIFDTEPRVRKAVAGFFAENITDLFETTLEDFGGEESLAEVLGEEDDEDYDAPKLSWLKLKCVAEALQSYDAEAEEENTQHESGSKLIAGSTDPRYALAAQTIFDGIPETREWEVLAGYLLCDFSITDQAKEEADAAFKTRCKPNEQEEILLLEILGVAVKGRLSEAAEAENDKKSKKTKGMSKVVQETAALHLAKVIPRLLKKFGSNPTTATAVLKLEHVLNLKVFQELRQDSTTYASLLDDINKQFLTHADQGVLAEASTALLHARGFEDLEEITGDKLGDLWDNTVDSLRRLVAIGAIQDISDLSHTVRRIENLSSITDCVDIFDRESRSTSKKKVNPAEIASPRSLLIDIINEPPLGSGREEVDELLVSAIRSLLFYYMWAARNLQNSITSGEPIGTPPDYSTFAEALISVIESHEYLSVARLVATGTLLDLHTLFATFRRAPVQATSGQTLDTVVQHITAPAQALILSTYTTLEKSYAKKSRKTLEAAPDEDLASDPEDSSINEDDEDDSHAQQESLMAEKQLCELTSKIVLAITGRVLDHDGPNKGKIKERIQRNKAKLGGNFKEVIAYLDGPKVKKGKRRAPATKKGGKKASKSVEVIEDDESGEDGPRYEEGGEQDLRERELVEDRIVDPDMDSVAGEDARPGADEVVDDDGDDDPMGD